MTEIIDLSQEIYSGMPVFNGLPEVQMSIHATHEQWDGITNPTYRDSRRCFKPYGQTIRGPIY